YNGDISNCFSADANVLGGFGCTQHTRCVYHCHVIGNPIGPLALRSLRRTNYTDPVDGGIRSHSKANPDPQDRPLAYSRTSAGLSYLAIWKERHYPVHRLRKHSDRRAPAFYSAPVREWGQSRFCDCGVADAGSDYFDRRLRQKSDSPHSLSIYMLERIDHLFLARSPARH